MEAQQMKTGGLEVGDQKFAHTGNMPSPVLFCPVTSPVSPFVFLGR